MNSLQFNSNLFFNSCIFLIAGMPTAFENLAQEDTINSEGTINDRMSGENVTICANATLVFVQEGSQQDLVSQ